MDLLGIFFFCMLAILIIYLISVVGIIILFAILTLNNVPICHYNEEKNIQTEVD